MLMSAKKTLLKLSLLPVIGASMLIHSAQAAEVKVGGKNFTEQLLVAEMTHQLLESKGFDSSKLDGMGTNVLRSAMENGQIDIYWEYTGTSLVIFNKIKDPMDSDASYAKVKELDAKKGITWLNPSKANNTWAFAMRAEGHENINSLSDLARSYNDGVKPRMSFGAEFSKRADGLRGLEKTYQFKVGRANYTLMDSGLIYNALKEGHVDVGQVFATDGRISAFNFRVLKDDAGFFPDYALVPTIRTETLNKHPELGDALNSISAQLDDKTLQELNAKVDVGRKSVETVAKQFLQDKGLI